jgi:hypothetical protein
MAKKGWELAVDLSQLRLVGEVDLPMMVYTYSALNNKVAGTADQDSAAFQARGGGGGFDQVAGEWTALRDRFQNILGRTANAMDAAGQAVVHIVAAYVASDTGARDSLASAWRDGPPGDPNEKVPGSPPPVVRIK